MMKFTPKRIKPAPARRVQKPVRAKPRAVEKFTPRQAHENRKNVTGGPCGSDFNPTIDRSVEGVVTDRNP